MEAATLSSAAFALMHFQPREATLHLFLFGMIACFCYARTRSLLAPILLHLMTNLWVELSALAFTDFETLG